MNNMPTTLEQIEINREFVSKELNRLYKIARNNDLIFSCVIHWAPLSKCLESRVAFFEERYEASLWEDSMRSTYSKLGVPFEVYSY